MQDLDLKNTKKNTEMKNEMRFYKVIIVAYMSINNLYPQVYMAKDIFFSANK